MSAKNQINVFMEKFNTVSGVWNAVIVVNSSESPLWGVWNVVGYEKEDILN